MPSADPPASEPRNAPPATPSLRLEHADWLDLARSLPPASVDLLYADPPFNTGRTQRGTHRASSASLSPCHGERAGVRGSPSSEPRFSSDAQAASKPAPIYHDTFPSTDAWLSWLRARLDATLPALKPTASVLLHVDWRTSHHARLLLDDLLGPDRFVNHLVWSYGLGGSSPRRFARKHDDILFYAVDPDRYHFEPPLVPATSNRMKGELKKATDVLDIPALNNMASERTGYPTQKPLALLDLLVRACCPEGGTVLDPCCGSGTTPVATLASGRHAIAGDINPDAVATARRRLSPWD